MSESLTHDPLCVEANLQALRPVSDDVPIVCKFEALCVCDLIARVRKDEREKAIDRLFGYRSEAAKVDGSLRMVFIAEEVIAAVRGPW